MREGGAAGRRKERVVWKWYCGLSKSTASRLSASLDPKILRRPGFPLDLDRSPGPWCASTVPTLPGWVW